MVLELTDFFKYISSLYQESEGFATFIILSGSGLAYGIVRYLANSDRFIMRKLSPHERANRLSSLEYSELGE